MAVCPSYTEAVSQLSEPSINYRVTKDGLNYSDGNLPGESLPCPRPDSDRSCGQVGTRAAADATPQINIIRRFFREEMTKRQKRILSFITISVLCIISVIIAAKFSIK